MHAKSKHALIALGSVAVITSVAVLVFAWRFVRAEVPASAKQQIKIGTSRSTVLELCGEPTGERSTESFFDYDRPDVLGWYAVSFDDRGLVSHVDDESF